MDYKPVTVIVGGGIGGLYAAHLLGKAGYPVTLLEQGDRWGGRIESTPMPSSSDTMFTAEFGPMRFEPGLQELLVSLAKELGLTFSPFAPTTAPVWPTEYELNDIEASFEGTSDLLMWAVLKMFFGEPLGMPAGLDHDPDWHTRGERELAALRAVADRYFEGEYETVQANLDRLRASQRLCGSTDPSAPLLRDLGLWNALTEVVSAGALARIRDSGTFYHFIHHNPNAAEWGIFWLRQASTRGVSIETFSPESAPGGVRTLVDRLQSRIEAQYTNVHMALGQRVTAIGHGRQPGEVLLTVEDRSDGNVYQLVAEHVILALPQAALTPLAAAFPEDVREALDAVMPLPLLKAFLVTEKPWWSHHFHAQSHAWLIPTRELHYYTLPFSPECPGASSRDADESACTCGPVRAGMVMLYTDVPAIDYWRPFIPAQDQFNALVYPRVESEAVVEDERLKRALVRQLLVEANPDVAAKIDMQRRRVESALRGQLNELGAELVDGARRSQVALSTHLRSYLTTCPDIQRYLLEMVFSDLFGQGESWVEALLETGTVASSKEAQVEAYLPSVLAYGIHDWSRPPFGGAAHAWRPGVDSIAVLRRLQAFGLPGRRDIENLHVCGEAYSDFHGFIEGALHSAEQVVARINGAHAAPAAAE